MPREARRSADLSSMPSQKTHFLDLEQRWLRAAESVAPNILRTDATTARPPIAFPKEADVEQRLRVTRGEDAAAPRGRDEIANKQAGSANLALTMQYRGLEQTIPLRFPTTPSQCWRSRRRSAKPVLVNSWARLLRLR